MLGVPSRQPRGQRAAAVAASRRRVWPGESWRAGTKTGSVISSRVSWLQSPRWEQEGESRRAMGGRGRGRAAASTHPLRGWEGGWRESGRAQAGLGGWGSFGEEGERGRGVYSWVWGGRDGKEQPGRGRRAGEGKLGGGSERG